MEVLAVEDLVLAKKTQRDKDWPMIRRLVEVHHAAHADRPNPDQIVFWLRQGRTATLLRQLAVSYPECWKEQIPHRPLLAVAVQPQAQELEKALFDEERRERELDRLYWLPLKMELEQLRHPPSSPERSQGTEPHEQ